MSTRALLTAYMMYLFLLCSSTPPCLASDDMQQAISLYQKNDFKQALAIFKRISETNKDKPTPYYYEAMCFFRLGDAARGKQFLQAIVQSFPGSQEARLSSAYLEKTTPSYASQTTKANSTSTASSAADAEASANLVGSQANGNVTDAELKSLPDETTVPFTRGQDGHLFVNAQVNGRTIRVMFDTGASTCVFGKNQLAAAGISTTQDGAAIKLSGVGSAQVSGAPMLVNLSLGKIERHMPIIVVDTFGFAPLLGETFYNGYHYDIENQTGLIRFVKKSSRASSVPYDAIEVPFIVEGNNMVVQVEVNGNSCPMYFDTGASSICFDISTFHQLGLQIPGHPQMVSHGGVGGAALGFTMTADQIKLGSLSKTNVPIVVLLNGGPPRPLLGQPFYSDRRYVIDNDKHVIKFFR